MRTQQEIDKLLQGLSPAEMADMLVLLDELDERKRISIAQNDFLAFIAAVDTTYKFGAHLKRLGNLLMGVEMGAHDRIAVSMAPRFGKSQMISIYYPAWYLGKHPDHKVIVASHTADLAVDMARKVRNLMQTDEYKRIFPGVTIASDAKAAGKWNTNKGGEYYATGVGGALAGRGGHLIIVDDPLSEQDIKSGNTDSLDTTYEWFRAGLRTRLMPGGKISVLHCLTGDTCVLRADGTETLLRDVRPGDMVASYDAGAFRPAKVLGWSNQGLDQVYSLTLKSGVIIRGNERHPLLVNNAGVEQWVTIKNLQPGMSLVSTKGAPTRPIAKPYEGSASLATTKSTRLNGLLGGLLSRLFARITHVQQKDALESGDLSSSQVHVAPATLESTTIRKTQMRHTNRWGITASGKVKLVVLKAAMSLRTLKGYVLHAAKKLGMRSVKPKVIIIARPSAATPISKCSMGSLALSTTECLSSKVASVQSVESPLTKATHLARGKFVGWLLTTATQLTKCVHSCAIPATLLSRNATPSSYSNAPLSTLSTTLDEIVSITLDGFEDVFDIQVEGTENFVANGVVSHNTRWHQRDLIGRLIKDGALNEDGDQYEIFEFPAILNEGTDDEKSLWPEQWPLESLLRTKASMPAWQWNAQYQQALALNTPIPTPTGWSTMNDLNVGDYVLSADGTPVQIVWKSPVFKDRPTYFVETDDGACVQADAEHLWEVQTMRADGPRMIKTTQWMFDRQEKRSASGEPPRRPRIRQSQAWELPAVDMPIDPYVLGAWLGDGSRGSAQFTSSDEDAVWWGAEFERLGYSLTKYDKQYAYRIAGAQTGLRAAGVLNHKHVPIQYLRASKEQRLALLQGLMDTDGHCSRGQAQFANTNLDLIHAVEQLVLSLGGKPCTVSFEPTAAGKFGQNPGKTCYKVQFYMEDAFRMPRKAAVARNKRTKHGRFVSLRPAPNADTVCIRVANPDGLFLAGERCLVTHNCPTAQESAIIKKDWIQWWPDEDPPPCDFIIQSWDTALTTKERSDYSVCQTWGVFEDEESRSTCVVLLNCVKGKWEFPELKQMAHDQAAYWKPDSIIIEAKASGQPLIDELRRSGLLVQDFSPGKGQDKIARLNAVSDMFSAGQVWFPETRWATEVVDELLAFPSSEHDDAVDALTLALRRARTGGLLRLNTDREDDTVFVKRRHGGYY